MYFTAWPGSTSASPSAACQHSPSQGTARLSHLNTPPSWTQVSTLKPWPPTLGSLQRLLPAAFTHSSLLMVARYLSPVNYSSIQFLLLVKADMNPHQGQLFTGSLEPSTASLGGWLQLVTAAPRHTSLLAGKNSGEQNPPCPVKTCSYSVPNSEMVKSLTAALARYTHEVSKVACCNYLPI